MSFANTTAKALFGLVFLTPLNGCANAPSAQAEDGTAQLSKDRVAEPKRMSPTPGPRIASEAEPFVDDFAVRNPDRWYVSHGWKNSDNLVNDWRKSQSRFGGPLSIVLEEGVTDEHAYSSGEVRSRARFGHGYFEATLRAAKGRGLLTGFFTYTGPHNNKPWNEIDVEIVGRRPNEVLMTYHFEGKRSTHVHKTGFDTTEGFHTYGFDWQPGYIEWYVDGEPVFRTTGEDLPLPNEKQKIFMTLLGSETLFSWLGKFDPSQLPATSQFACVGYSLSADEGKPCWDKLQAQ